MRVALTGATGRAGFAVARHLSALGHQVVALGRNPVPDLAHVPWRLGDSVRLDADALVHCAFAHVPGRYRGGEGDDPASFMALNRDGTRRLLDGAAGARVVFLSSRAVYGACPPGTRLTEVTRPRPDTLYGRLKLETESHVAERGGVSLRATGLYGPPPPGRDHKWADLFADFTAGHPVAPRVGTELHVDDLAAAVALVLRGPAPPVLNVSDIMLDRRDLLRTYAQVTGRGGTLPDRADPTTVSEMDCALLRTLGWRPRGWAGLRSAVAAMLVS